MEISRAVTYALILSTMPSKVSPPTSLPNTVDYLTYLSLLSRQKQVNLGRSLLSANSTDLLLAMDLALKKALRRRKGENSSSNGEEDFSDEDEEDEEEEEGDSDTTSSNNDEEYVNVRRTDLD